MCVQEIIKFIFKINKEKDMHLKFDEFVNMKKITKTLKFKLVPQGKTLEFMQNEIKNDQERAEAYPIVKELIDEVYRDIINTSFIYENIKKCENDNKIGELKFTDLAEALTQRDDKNIENFSKEIRNQLNKIINQDDRMEKIKGKKFIDLIAENYQLGIPGCLERFSHHGQRTG